MTHATDIALLTATVASALQQDGFWCQPVGQPVPICRLRAAAVVNVISSMWSSASAAPLRGETLPACQAALASCHPASSPSRGSARRTVACSALRHKHCLSSLLSTTACPQAARQLHVLASAAAADASDHPKQKRRRRRVRVRPAAPGDRHSPPLRRHVTQAPHPAAPQPPQQQAPQQAPAQPVLKPPPVRPPVLRDVPTTSSGSTLSKYLQPGKLVEFKYEDENVLGLVLHTHLPTKGPTTSHEAVCVDASGREFSIKPTQVVVVLPGRNYKPAHLHGMHDAADRVTQEQLRALWTQLHEEAESDARRLGTALGADPRHHRDLLQLAQLLCGSRDAQSLFATHRALTRDKVRLVVVLLDVQGKMQHICSALQAHWSTPSASTVRERPSHAHDLQQTRSITPRMHRRRQRAGCTVPFACCRCFSFG